MGPDILMGETWRQKVRKEKLRDRRRRVAEPHRGRETETKVEQVRERSTPESMKHSTFTGWRWQYMQTGYKQKHKKEREVGWNARKWKQGKASLCGLFYLQSPANKYLSNQIMVMQERRHPAHCLMRKKVITYQFSNYIFVFLWE